MVFIATLFIESIESMHGMVMNFLSANLFPNTLSRALEAMMQELIEIAANYSMRFLKRINDSYENPAT